MVGDLTLKKLSPKVTKSIKEKSIDMGISKVLEESMGNYGYNINLFRSFPNIFDGLKPVARRIIFSMYGLKLLPGGQYKKVASVVGDVLGKTHPHGDASVFDALVKMSQDFYMNIPIVNGWGNFGSQSGDEASAMRYIECKMSNYCKDFLEDIDKNAVNWKDNFDQSLLEPETLPVKYPNLLINGSYGIGQAYITSIPSHNFSDIADIAIKIIKNSDITVDEVANMILPDFPTGGIIINKSELAKFYARGIGSIKIRAKISTTPNNDLLITEIPYMVTLGAIKDKIQEKVKDETIIGISDIKDETNEKNGIKLTIKIKKGFDPSVVESLLYKYTPLQTTLNLNLICTEGLSFRVYNIFELFTKWIDYRKSTLKRIFNFKISKISKRLHIIEGLLITLDPKNIDKLIAIIKKSKDRKSAIDGLITAFRLSKIQSEAIVDLQLHKLTSIGINDLKEEYQNLKIELQELNEYFSDPDKLNDFIIKELKEGKKKYHRERKTLCEDIMDDNQESIIANTNHTIFITKEGYVKKLSLDISSQGKGGKGRSVGKMKDNDYIISAFNANNKDNLLCFTNQGRVFCIKIYDLKDNTLTSYGYLLNTYIQLRKNEYVVSTLTLENDEYKKDDAYLIFVSKKGLIKRSSLSHYNAIPKSGIIALKLNDNDSLVDVKYTDEDCDVIIGTKKGLGTRFKTDDVGLTLRISLGMKGINLNDEDDEVITFTLMGNDEKRKLFVVTDRGNGKLINMSSFETQNRTNKSKIICKLKSNEELLKFFFVNDNDEITLIGNKKMIKLKTSDISVLIRSSFGTKIMDLGRDEKVVDALVE